MLFAGYFWINFPLSKENKTDNKVQDKAAMIPHKFSFCTPKIKYKPRITKRPKNTSYRLKGRLYRMGSKTEVIKEAEDKIERVSEIDEILMA